MSNPNSPFGNFHLRTEIPYFSGEYVDWWIYHLECFFYKRRTIPEMKIRVAEVYMVGEALHWYQEWDWKARWSWQRITWETFVEDLKNRFKPSEIVKSEVLESILMDLEKVKQLIGEMRAQNLAFMASLSEMKHHSSTISLDKLTESKAAEEERFDSKLIISTELDSRTEDLKDNASVGENPDETVITNSVLRKFVTNADDFYDNYKVPHNSSLLYLSHNMEFTEVVDDSLQGALNLGKNENDMSLFCTQAVCENVPMTFSPGSYCLWCFTKILSTLKLSGFGKPPPRPPDIFSAFFTYHEFWIEDRQVAQRHHVSVYFDGNLKTLEHMLDMLKSYPRSFTFWHDSVLKLWKFEEQRIEQLGYKLSEMVLSDSSIYFEGVCENAYGVFLYFEMGKLFQIQRLHGVMNGVWFILDYIEQPPSFPPDLAQNIISYHGCRYLIKFESIHSLDCGFGHNLCLVLGVMLITFEDYYCNQHGLRRDGNQFGAVSESHFHLMLNVNRVFQQFKDGSACSVLITTRDDDGIVTLMLEISSIQWDDILFKLIIISDGLIFMRMSHNVNTRYTIGWTLPLLGNEWYFREGNGMIMVHHLGAITACRYCFALLLCTSLQKYQLKIMNEFGSEANRCVCLGTWKESQWLWNTDASHYVCGVVTLCINGVGHFTTKGISSEFIAAHLCDHFENGMQFGCHTDMIHIDHKLVKSVLWSLNNMSQSGSTWSCVFEERKWRCLLNIIRKNFEYEAVSYNFISWTILKWDADMEANEKINDYMDIALGANIIVVAITANLSPIYYVQLIQQTNTSIGLCLINEEVGYRVQRVSFVTEGNSTGLGLNASFPHLTRFLCPASFGKSSYFQILQQNYGLEPTNSRLLLLVQAKRRAMLFCHKWAVIIFYDRAQPIWMMGLMLVWVLFLLKYDNAGTYFQKQAEVHEYPNGFNKEASAHIITLQIMMTLHSFVSFISFLSTTIFKKYKWYIRSYDSGGISYVDILESDSNIKVGTDDTMELMSSMHKERKVKLSFWCSVSLVQPLDVLFYIINPIDVKIVKGLYHCLRMVLQVDITEKKICTNLFFIFSLPRPPEIFDLEDKVIFKGEGMLRVNN